MPGAHDEKLIAEKYSIDYPRRPLSTRIWRRRWNWLALFLGCLVGTGLYFVQGNAAFWAAPVSTSHTAFAMDCRKCHSESWQPALRLASLDSGRHSVPNAACRDCHQVGDHHPRLGEQEPACASCHQEHRPEVPLLAIADNHCTSCHGNLGTVPNSELRFEAEIGSFAAGSGGHPEFALLRAGEPAHKSHGTWQVAVPDSAAGKWIDNGGVIFNHKVHLAPEGVLDANRRNVKLTCATCHEPAADGRTMKPIVYEQQCASCHPLRLADDLASLGDLPHEKPELVIGAIRQRLTNLQIETKPAQAAPTIPRLPQPTVLTESQTKSADALLAAADHAVFGLEAKGLCRKCHHLEIRDAEWHVPTLNPEFTSVDPSAAREMIPSRWLKHGEFDHESHLTLKCGDCHAAAASSETSDVLLPGIDNCRKCHGAESTTATVGVASDCIMCHDYHGQSPLSPTTSHVDAMDMLRLHDEVAGERVRVRGSRHRYTIPPPHPRPLPQTVDLVAGEYGKLCRRLFEGEGAVTATHILDDFSKVRWPR
jgi:hypothetical protein